MRIFRTLYAKIFVWFWVTLTAGSLLIVLAAVFTGAQPLGRRWARLTQDMYAHSAVDFYITGGAPALQRYLAALRDSSGIEGVLLDANGRDVLGQPTPPELSRVLQRSMQSGESVFTLGRVWTAASPAAYQQRQFYFVMEVTPLRGSFVRGALVRPLLWRVALALVIAGLFCMVLTRHIMTPVRALQSASLRLAAGDLGSRVLPAIAPRDDELADTARAFDQMADRIQDLVQKRQELLANISHELRSPLTRAAVSLELLRRGELDVLDQLQSDLDRMNTMIGEILLLTRLDLQTAPAERFPLDLTAMVESIARDAEFEVQYQSKQVVVRASGACTVCADANLLRSCIENIVRNAAHHTGAGTAVEITIIRNASTQAHPYCEVVVRDHGPGVPQEALPNLFDPFYRVSQSRDPSEGGTGLGLSISHKVAELHQGFVSASNRTDGQGLEVVLRLPCA
jgi:two-component system sensor histidine kinase CpxA